METQVIVIDALILNLLRFWSYGIYLEIGDDPIPLGYWPYLMHKSKGLSLWIEEDSM